MSLVKFWTNFVRKCLRLLRAFLFNSNFIQLAVAAIDTMDDSSEEEEDRYLLLLEDARLSFQYPAVFTVMTAVLAVVTID